MHIAKLLEQKKRGQALSADQIAWFVEKVTDETLPDYQIAAMLMAICIRGMTDEETTKLALCMADSASRMDLSAIEGRKVDKHSTGGVGDGTTLIAVPLVAACGARVGKMSGRGLGHTGGTVDKLEAIPGMRVELSMDDFVRQVNTVGCALMSQTQAIAPADKKLYALRDVTATVDSLPLIAASIMSKKIASGCDAVVLDVKTGNGALMTDLAQAKALARIMVAIGKQAGVEAFALVTDMSQPLGTHIGNALEVREAIDVLSGRADAKSARLTEVSLLLAEQMLLGAGAVQDKQEARQRLNAALSSGAGLEKLRQMISAQGGEARVCDDAAKYLPKAGDITQVVCQSSGYVSAIDCQAIGWAAQHLGAGRSTKADAIDPAVGIVMKAQLGDFAEKGQPLAIIHANDKTRREAAGQELIRSITLGPEKPSALPLVYQSISG